jgi:hypothetical protein
VVPRLLEAAVAEHTVARKSAARSPGGKASIHHV